MGSTNTNLSLPFALITTLSLIWATCIIAAEAKQLPLQSLSVLLPYLYQPLATDCMDRAVFLRVGTQGTSFLTYPDSDYTDQSGEVIADRVAQMMSSRWERVVYVTGDRDASYDDVAALIGRLKGATSDLNVVLVSQADLSGLRSGLCLGTRVRGSR